MDCKKLSQKKDVKLGSICWFYFIEKYSKTYIEGDKEILVFNGVQPCLNIEIRWSSKKKFYNYKNGIHKPHKNLQNFIEERVPNASYWLNLDLWLLLTNKASEQQLLQILKVKSAQLYNFVVKKKWRGSGYIRSLDALAIYSDISGLEAILCIVQLYKLKFINYSSPSAYIHSSITDCLFLTLHLIVYLPIKHPNLQPIKSDIRNIIINEIFFGIPHSFMTELVDFNALENAHLSLSNIINNSKHEKRRIKWLKRENLHFYFYYFSAVEAGCFDWFLINNHVQNDLDYFVSVSYNSMLTRLDKLNKRQSIRHVTFDSLLTRSSFKSFQLADVFGENIFPI